MIPVRLPDGRTIQVNTKDPDVAAKAAHSFRIENPHPERSALNTAGGLAGDFLDGMVPGAAGAVRGVRQAIVNAVQAPFSSDVDFHPFESFREGRNFQEARQKQATTDHPTLASAAQVGGMGAGLILPAAKVARAASLAQKVAAGAKTAGAYGALSGALSSRRTGLLGVANDALEGGLIGSGMGTALPLAAKAVGALAAPISAPLVSKVSQGMGRGLQAVSDYLPGRLGDLAAAEGAQLSRDPARAFALRAADRAIRSESNSATGHGWTPAQAAQEVRNRNAQGVPAMLADVHDGARKALKTATRSQGPALASVRRMIDQRQEAQGIRIADQVRAHLGPTTNVDREAEAIRERASTAARSHYDAAYAAPGASDGQIADILDNQSGAMRGAFAHARELALRERRDPTALGFDLDPGTNEVSLNRVPSFETLDLVKRGLEGVADRTRDVRGNVTNDGRTILNMSRPLVARMRQVNPHYGQALDAYGGEIRGRDAIEAGRDALKNGADDLANLTDGQTPWERQNFALGHRSAMATDMSDFARKTPYGNAAGRLRQNFGMPGTDTYRALQDIHGPSAIDSLSQIGEAEHEAHQTYKALRSNSSVNSKPEADPMPGAAKGALAALTGYWGPAALAAVSEFGKGNWKAAETNGQLGSLLSLTDPAAVTGTVRSLGREKARGALVEQKKGRALAQASKALGALSSAGMVQPFVDPDDIE